MLYAGKATIKRAERSDRVVNIPASYSRGPEFKSKPAILTEVFRSFPQSLQANTGIVPLPSKSFPIY
jgi:hypothetical protein